MAPRSGELEPVSKIIEEMRTTTQGIALERVLLETKKTTAKEGSNIDAISQNGKNQIGIVVVKKSVQYPVPTKA